MNIYEKLLAIQTELKAPKSQYNSFGKYNYRNCEDILEAVKPICKKYNAVLFLTDDIIYVEGRHYVKATATLIDCEKPNEIVCVSANAREEAEKKGMDGSQVTGASSSYARKYALNGLFDIDDTKDSDTTNTGDKVAKEKPAGSANNSTASNAQPPKPTAQASGAMSLAQAKAYCFTSGKNANKPFGEASDGFLTWVSQKGNGKAKEAADIILKNRNEVKSYQQSLIEDTSDETLPF